MKTTLSILGGLAIILLVTLLDSSLTSDESTNYYQMIDEESVDADTSNQSIQKSVSTYFEYRLEEMKEVDGYIVETYQEYEVHEDAEGEVISRIPTSNYNYLKYQKE
ncbi:hypothetical protein [Ornithinibacillus contaminans]|uniref:hypothetical protein n=1 Tax=Ornithinibacillus contaminans TaxID=694055 RepID=UPI00064DF7B4|nr:hypothetical protein [Ornithinibacillus contaminans]